MGPSRFCPVLQLPDPPHCREGRGQGPSGAGERLGPTGRLSSCASCELSRLLPSQARWPPKSPLSPEPGCHQQSAEHRRRESQATERDDPPREQGPRRTNGPAGAALVGKGTRHPPAEGSSFSRNAAGSPQASGAHPRVQMEPQVNRGHSQHPDRTKRQGTSPTARGHHN